MNSNEATRLLSIVLAGGKGNRLRPLTSHCAKPAVPFAGHYRIIDFVLSNCINSGCHDVLLLSQYEASGLHHYVQQHWQASPYAKTIQLVAAPADANTGTAGAVYQQLDRITKSSATHLCVLSADHIYKMDFRQMLDFHERKQACLTVAAIPVPVAIAHHFGVIALNSAGRMTGFIEKPSAEQAQQLANADGMVLASMGNYIFNRHCLLKVLQQDAAEPNSQHDFGHDIIPRMYPDEPVYVYEFLANTILGEEGNQAHYWRDVGTLDAFYQAHMDLLGPCPKVRLRNRFWPISGPIDALPPSYIAGSEQSGVQIQDSLISAGCELSHAHIRHSVLGPNCRVHQQAQLDHCVLLGNVEVGANARLQRCIVAENSSIAPYSLIGHESGLDQQRFECTESGVIVVPANSRVGYH
ncbi:sugar phosphate nucleotidyltransferase [Alkalimonas collagenimarina]|uniref:Sugar phosphate nucleotidyltransferase n=1 Tax=Alkalimonas collagenimarina TaxID=400390 RepID=A0ABT9GZY4_9GAMM|nr:sugar phosphate nucleotidyltransferase [Alkalimonas collagenimarina]MDP4536607.1 sugar phosphate nucleotidyltransferase [Alkalimonas collagenimarina]